MSKGRKLTLAICALIILLLVASEFQACFWPRSFARAQAFRRVKQLCVQDGRDPKLLSQPRDATIGGAPWAFEWTYEGRPRYVYGIWISRSGTREFYGGDPDDPASAAYHPK